MKVLIVGAGSVGQVYGRHFQLGGADVAFLVKEKHAEEARRGFTLYALKESGRTPLRFEGFEVLTALDGRKWDAILLAVSSPAIRGAWLDELARRSGDATIVMLQPGLTDHAHVAERVGQGRLVSGLIGFMAYSAPLPGEKVPEPGTAYWFPPLAPCPFSGPPERVAPVVETLARGGFPAKAHRDVQGELAFKGAVFETYVLALECAGWRFAELRRDRELVRLGARAAREVASLAEKVQGRKAPAALMLAGPLGVRMGMRVVSHLAPFDLETFFKVHFTKVAEQTREMFETYASLAARHGVATPALEALRQRIAS
ncbi:MAG TPA: 2-dehydropantoate 2-reductase N-terminal domain-containing protein [Haliangiales bacterium]|nr:2-dehydropantoate 2-reductase N-terminal domain-containing protein [Haliangiales bacterium]